MSYTVLAKNNFYSFISNLINLFLIRQINPEFSTFSSFEKDS